MFDYRWSNIKGSSALHGVFADDRMHTAKTASDGKFNFLSLHPTLTVINWIVFESFETFSSVENLSCCVTMRKLIFNFFLHLLVGGVGHFGSEKKTQSHNRSLTSRSQSNNRNSSCDGEREKFKTFFYIFLFCHFPHQSVVSSRADSNGCHALDTFIIWTCEFSLSTENPDCQGAGKN